MKPAHVYATLAPDDARQSEAGDRSACVRCDVLRSPRFGGGYVYSPSGTGRSDWQQKRPECSPKEGR